MPSITELELFAVDLPFRRPFTHAAARRTTSDSIFLTCKTDAGAVGFGECLPRAYVTGESRDRAFDLLQQRILPRLMGMRFDGFEEVLHFLRDADGRAPADWVPPDRPQTAAWCAVDLALLDTFGKAFATRAMVDGRPAWPHLLRYSPVVSADASLKTLGAIRLLAFPQVKVKVTKGAAVAQIARVRKILGRKRDIRIDANMAWTPDEALAEFPRLHDLGVRSCEQPVGAEDIVGLAQLVRTSAMTIMVDESFNDRDSLVRLIKHKACHAVNVRVSKCGGLVASLNRCREAEDAGLAVQTGCQVGESSLLSAAHMTLTAAAPRVAYAEGCFGRLLLTVDPARPVLTFGPGGRPPAFPSAPGLGVTVDRRILQQYASRTVRLG